MSEKQRLWEVEHPYYCNEGNYFNNNCGTHFKNLSEFLAEWGDADPDYNLLFRWDWDETNEDGDFTFNGDRNYRNGVLKCFWMGQSKGLYTFCTVEVCRSDEPAVTEFLKPRLAHLLCLWAPLGI